MEEQRACASGTGVFYICNANGFKGCCLVDPCALSDCPDLVSLSSIAIVTTVILTAQSPIPTSVLGSTTVTMFTERSTAISSSISDTSSTSSSTNIPALISSTTSTSTTTQSAVPSKARLKNAPLIAGIVVGIVVLAILFILGWICLSRRRTLKESRLTRKSNGPASPSNDFVFERANSTEIKALRKPSGDIFAPFGGRHTPLQTEPAELAQHPAYASPGQGSYQQSMTSHPAYHVSQLNTRPAFRNVQVSHAPPTRSHQSIHTSYLFAIQRTGQMDEVVSPLISSSLISSPVAGIMELEADAPASYISPTVNTGRHSMLQQNTVKIKAKSSSTTQRIPIGLGVGVFPAASSSSSAPSLSLPLPTLKSTFVPASSSAWRNSSTPPLLKIRSAPRIFISTGPEIVSHVQRAAPRTFSSSLSDRSQTHPILSRLEPSHRATNRGMPSSSYNSASEKETGFSDPISNQTSQRWSDAIMVTPVPISRPFCASLSVPNLITAARLIASPSPNTSPDDGRPSSAYTETPISAYTDGTAT